MLQVGSIWHPTWLHFGLVLAPKLEPNWHQDALKIDPTNHQKINPQASQQANNEKSKNAQNHYNLQYVRALGYLNLGRKTIKNGSNILPKLASKTMLQIRAILEPTWLHFGMVLAPKLEPS